MPKLVIISERELVGLEPSDAWTSVTVTTLAEASELFARGDVGASIVDFSCIEDSPTTVADELHGEEFVPTVAIVPAAMPSLGLVAKRLNMACVDEEWVAACGADVINLCLGHVLGAYERARELQSFKDRQRQMVHAEKFAAVGLLAAEIAHEINNPATFVITNLTVMHDYVETIDTFHAALKARLDAGDLDAASYRELAKQHEISFLSEDLDSLLERSLAGLRRIHQIVQDLRFFSHDRRTESGPVDLLGLIAAAMSLVRHEARFHAEVVVDLDPLPRVVTDPNRLSQVFLNVLVNAVQSIPPGRPAENEVRITGGAADDFVDIRIRDTGVGISSDQLEQVFEPFFTTKEPGKGTGLGLAISRDIMRSLGGDILADSEPGKGSQFTIRIPREAPDDDE